MGNNSFQGYTRQDILQGIYERSKEHTQYNLSLFFASLPEMVAWQGYYKGGLSYYVSYDVELESMYAIENYLLYNNHQTALHREGYKGKAVYVGQIEICDLLQKEFKGYPYHVSEIVCNQCYTPLTSQEIAVYPLQWQHSGDMYCSKHEKREQFKPVDSEKRSTAWDKMLDSEIESQNKLVSHFLAEGIGDYSESDEVEEAYKWQEMQERLDRQYMG